MVRAEVVARCSSWWHLLAALARLQALKGMRPQCPQPPSSFSQQPPCFQNHFFPFHQPFLPVSLGHDALSTPARRSNNVLVNDDEAMSAERVHDAQTATVTSPGLLVYSACGPTPPLARSPLVDVLAEDGSKPTSFHCKGRAQSSIATGNAQSLRHDSSDARDLPGHFESTGSGSQPHRLLQGHHLAFVHPCTSSPSSLIFWQTLPSEQQLHK